MIQASVYKVYIIKGSKILTIFQIVELQSPSLSAHLTVGVKGGSSMGLTLLHDDGLDTSLILPGDAISTLIFFFGVCVRNMHHFRFLMYVCNLGSLSTYRKNTGMQKSVTMQRTQCDFSSALVICHLLRVAIFMHACNLGLQAY